MSTQLKDSKWADARRKARRALTSMSDEEDAAIKKAAAADPDNPPIDDRRFAAARPAAEVATDLVQHARDRHGRSRPGE
jgi:hypothetical protein